MAMDGLAIKNAVHSRLDELDLDRLEFGEVFADHMFTMIYETGAWQPPEIVPYGSIPMEPGIMSLHYAQMVFEGLKAYRGDDGVIRLFRPDQNAERLRNSCRRMCIPEMPEQTFIDAIDRLVAVDQAWVPDRPGYALYIRPLVFSMERHLQVRPSTRYLFVVVTAPAGSYFRPGGAGLSLLVETTYARTAPSGGVGDVKTAANYATTFFAAEAAQRQGFDQVLWLDGATHRYVEEAGLMNVFFKIEDRVVTPELNGAILPGITRASIIQLIKDRGIEIEERPVTIEEVKAACVSGAMAEIFVTGTAAVVLPVQTLAHDGKTLKPSASTPGPLTQSLYDELTGIQFGQLEDRHGWTKIVGV